MTVTLNAALDVTYELGRVTIGDTNRVDRVRECPGGKGLNVARTLDALGEPVLACGLLGGRTGEVILAGLAATGVRTAFTTIRGESRRTVVLAEPGRTTVVNEPGPTVTSDEWQAFRAGFQEILATSGAAVVVLSGSLPPGVPVDAYAELGRACGGAGIRVVLDADGEPLRHGLAGRPAVVKPNVDELARLGLADGVPLLAAAEAVRAAGAAAVVVSRGPDGLVAVTPDGAWGAVPPVVTGNPTGAGDALVAALARGLVHGSAWPDRLRDGAALSAATVQAEGAGSFDMSTYLSLLPRIELSPLSGP